MINKRSLSKIGSKNPNFGKIKERPSLSALHEYMHKKLIKPKECTFCHKKKKLELSSIKHRYTRNKKDWQWLCKKCHFHYDGHGKYLALKRVPGVRYQKKCLNCKTIINNIIPSLLKRKKYCSRQCLALHMWKKKIFNHI